LLATGVKILAGALVEMSKLSWSEIERGLVAMAGGLGLMAGALALLPPSSLLSAAAILIVATSLSMIGDALGKMGQLSWSEINKGLVALAGSLGIISLAMIAMTEALPGAAALLIVAASLGMLASAMNVMGGMSWSEIGKSLVELAGSLLIITAAMIGMTEALPGAAALLVVAGALAILAPVLVVFGNMGWDEIAKGMVVLAGAFTIIGIAGALLTPVVPTLLGLGAAIILLGAGAALAGVGILALSAGLAALAISGAAGGAALVALVAGLIGLIPAALKAVGEGIIAFAGVIAAAGPAITNAIVTVLNSLIDATNRLAPKIVDTLLSLLSKMVDALLKYVPHMVDSGLKLVTGILNGIAKNIGAIVKAGTNVVVNFINGVSANLPRIINAGLNLIVNFVNGLANGIRSHTAAMQAAGRNLASAIIDGMTGGLASGVGKIVDEAQHVASSALAAAKRVLGIHSPSKEFYNIGAYVNQGFAQGLKSGNKADVDNAFNSLKSKIASAMQDSAKNVDTLTAKLKKLQSARHKDNTEIKATKAALAEANKEHAAESKAYTDITKQLANSHTQLGNLANQYAALTTKIKDATSAYNDAVKARDDFKQQITDQFSDVPTPTADQSPADFITALQKQLDDTKKLSNELQVLRKEGLNDQTFKDLLAAGTSSLPFVDSLVAGGPSDIKQINDLEKQLNDAAAQLGQTASTQLYQAGVDAAAGLVKGLQQQQAAIQAQMNKIAAAMVASIKKALGIKSPSRAFAEIGGYSADGLAKGLTDSTGVVTDAAASIGDQAVSALQASLANTSKMTLAAIDTQPTIRPVLDLTQVQKDASGISDALNKATISTSGAYTAALSTSAAVRAGTGTEDGMVPGSNNLTFNQYNTSPKAISAADTYRNTKNQISVAKGVLQK
jgi:uncharacterized coiled-coil DUF342 family protein